MRKAPESQHVPGEQPLPWAEPADFCFAPSWPKQAPGPPPIKNPVQHSSKSRHNDYLVKSNAVNNREGVPTSVAGGLKKMMSEGQSRGQSEAKLLCTYAANRAQAEMTQLLKSGADVNVFAKVDWQNFETTPLLEAATNGHKRLVRMLLEHGADPNTVIGPGWTALYNACLNSHYDCVKLLIEHGARVDMQTDDKFTPLYISCQVGDMDCTVECLGAEAGGMTKELADFGPPELGGATALYIATQNGFPNCVMKLLEAGVNPDPQTTAGSTPLMIAMYLADTIGDKPHIDCARLLLEHGASLEVKDNEGKTALDWCGRDNSLIAMIEDEQERRAEAAKGRSIFF